MDALQHVERFGLIVHGVERGDDLKGLGVGGSVEVRPVMQINM